MLTKKTIEELKSLFDNRGFQLFLVIVLAMFFKFNKIIGIVFLLLFSTIYLYLNGKLDGLRENFYQYMGPQDFELYYFRLQNNLDTEAVITPSLLARYMQME